MPHRVLTLLLALAVPALATLPAAAEEDAKGYVLEDFAEGLSHPWSMAYLPDGRILLSELSGDLRILGRDGTPGPALEGVPEVVFARQGGLSDVILAPDFRSSGRIFFSYSARDPNQDDAVTLFVASALLEETRLNDVRVVFRAQAPRSAEVHFGAKMVFLRDGTLMIASGDAFDHREKAQTLDNHFGKMVRINPDGSVPRDNPFVNEPGALPEIWSYGHRNMQGLVLAPDGTLYEHEHGPRGGDEFNRIEKGRNYGWPLICHCLDYSFAVLTPFTEAPGLEQPLHHWVPSIAPSGLALYTARNFPRWQGSFFVAGLVPGDVRRLHPDGEGGYDEETLFAEMGERIRNIYQTPDGNLMLMTDGPQGRLVLVKPAPDAR